MPVEDKLNLLDRCTGQHLYRGFESLRLRSLHGFPALWQHIECQRVTVGILIAFQYCHWRQHMPDTVIIEDVTFTAFAHGEAIYFILVIVGYDDFATLSPAATQ